VGGQWHVRATLEEYQKLATGHISIVDQLGMPGVEQIEFHPPGPSNGSARPAHLS